MAKYCTECGTLLTLRSCKGETEKIPFCEHCNDYRFPVFNAAISTVVLNPSKNKILMMRQNHREKYTLLAGYINKGESAEDALVREVREEIVRKVIEYRFMRSCYYEKSNTLMFNFLSVIDDEDVSQFNRSEVDFVRWFEFSEVFDFVLPDSLASSFLFKVLDEKQYLAPLEPVEKIKQYPQHFPIIRTA